jgi:quercetin dioxygenase-like cupin family protein
MPVHHKAPTVVEAAGSKPKIIREYIGRINSNDSNLSIAHMKSPSGWVEPGQQPDFAEYTIVLKGAVHVKTKDSTYIVKEGEAITCLPNEWVQYSTPDPSGAEYIAVCLPAFTMDSVHRDSE